MGIRCGRLRSQRLGSGRLIWSPPNDVRSTPPFLPFCPRGAHNAGILTVEVTVHYPFHPLKGQSFLVAGQFEHYGALHVVARGADGVTRLVPAWMTAPEAAVIHIMDAPRLSVQRFIELRELLDRIMVVSSTRESTPAGGPDNAATEKSTTEPVRHTASQSRIVSASANTSTGVARSSADGSDRRKSQSRKQRATGGRS